MKKETNVEKNIPASESKKIITRRPNGSIRVATKNLDPDKTDTSWGPDTDVNNIVNKWTRTGQNPHPARSDGQYVDISQVTDLMGAVEVVQQASASFDALPSELRATFQNDPIQMVEFLNDPKNHDQAREMGLLPPQPKKQAPPEPKKIEEPPAPIKKDEPKS